MLGSKLNEIDSNFILALSWYNPNSLLFEHLSNHVVHTVITSNVSVLIFLWWFWPLCLPLCFALVDSVKRDSHTAHHLPPSTEGLVIKPDLEWLPSKSINTSSFLFISLCVMNILCVTLIVASAKYLFTNITDLYLDHLSQTGIGLSAAQHDSSQCSQDKHLGQELSPNSVHFAVLKGKESTN